jgi:hypothetical protein
MKKRFAPTKSVPSFFMFATIFVAITIPLVVMGLSGDGSFDIRNKAYETGSPTTSNPCVIYFPKVNPDTLEVNGEYKVSIEAISTIKDIEGIKIVDDGGTTLFEKDYTSLTDSVKETFTYSPKATGNNFIRGSLIKVTGEEACPGEGITIISKNTAPEITSEDINSDISVGDSYEYIITAEDIDTDIVNFAYSFTPRADWLKKTVIEDGSDGNVKIKLQGTPDEPASYLAHIFVHDGYGNHLSSMSWVINVSQDENDIPSVRILSPSKAISADVGDEIETKWIASDQNQIIKYQIYASQDPTDSDTWKEINTNISYKTTAYDVNTSGLSGGVYRLIIRAIDNQDPAGIGFAISPEISLQGEGPDDTQDTDDDIVLLKPQIINVTPNNSSEVENPRPLVRATLIAGTDATVLEDTISFKLNDKDITENIRLNKISDREITFIYQPKEDITAGIQKVTLSFEDSNENTTEKEWTFTIVDTSPDTDEDIFVIFGIEISKKLALIVGAGIVVIILAILVPIIIYKMWSTSKDYSKIVNRELPPKMPKSGGMYELEKDVNTKPKEVTPSPTREELETQMTKFSSPTLEELDKEIKEEKPKEKEVVEEEIDKPETPKDAWKPKLVDQAEVTTSEPVQEEVPSTTLPDLAIPTPETFTKPKKEEQPIQAPPATEKTPDEITKLYEEIQKVEKQEEGTGNQNS